MNNPFYIFKTLLILVISEFVFTLTAYSQNISGIINSYIEVTGVNNNQAAVDVVSVSGINIHDTLIIIQMQGADIDISNNVADNGNVTSFNGAGSWEMVEVCDISGNTIHFKKKFKHNYDASGHIQLIPVNRYTNAVITGTITCAPWNGTTGGIVVIFNSGTLDFQSGIDVSGKGFRKAVHNTSTYSCNILSQNDNFNYDITTGLGAYKGEGVAEVTNNNERAGRGPRGNGGGGGNDHNSGGGGGGNIAAGGIGGENQDPGAFNCKGYFPGLGGRSLSSNNERLFLGGGGGAGHSNSIPWPTDGGDGGGIVIIVSDQINGNSQTVSGYGTNALQAHGDGAGGGGAGGSVLIICDTINTTLTIDVHGGNGGDMDASIAANTDRCFGPGGGGAGGLLRVSSSSLPATISATLYGGNPGVVVLSTAACNGDSIGATRGGYGVIELNGEIENGIYCSKYCDKVPQVNLGGYQYTCGTDAITLDATNPNCTYQWSTGETTSTISVITSDTFWVAADNGYCIATDTVRVENFSYPDFPVQNSYYVCQGDAALLDAGNPGCSYLWNTGDTTQTISVATTGSYTVTIQNSNCSIQSSFEVEACFDPPNTITPDGDGKNDSWIIDYIQQYEGHKVEIYNRRGQLVYQSAPYYNNWNAEGLPAGVYYFIIDLNNGKDKIKGTITVVRQK